MVRTDTSSSPARVCAVIRPRDCRSSSRDTSRLARTSEGCHRSLTEDVSGPRLASPTMSNDFDFLHGSWDIANRRLVKRLVGSDEWDEFPGTCTCRGFFDGAGSFDE